MTIQRYLYLGSACVAAISSPALAAEQPHQTSTSAAVQNSESASTNAKVASDEIVVTAQKRGAQTLIETPLAISAFDGENLEKRGVNGVADFIQEVPGATVIATQPGFNRVQIRGISAVYGDSPVGYYIDELPFTLINVPTQPDIRGFDIDRVEVLRGPQGTLYGDGSLGGVIRFITKDADTSEFSGKADVGVTSSRHGNEGYSLRGAINLPLVTDKLAIRLVALNDREAGFIDSRGTGDKDVNTARIQSYRLKWTFKATNDLTIRGTVWRSITKADGPSSGFDDLSRPGGVPEPIKVAYTLYNGVIDYDLGPLTLTSSSSYIDFDNEYVSDLTVAVGNIGQNVKNFSQEIRGATKLDGPFQLTFGGFYRNLKDTTSYVYSSAVVPTLNFSSRDSVRSKSYALFSEGTISLMDGKLQLIGGLRYFHDKRTQDSIFAGSPFPNAEAKFDAWTPKVTVSYQPTSTLNLYATYARGFRSGQVQPPISQVTARAFGLTIPTSVKPEKLNSYEIGLKASLLNRKLDVDLAVYYNDYKDLQLVVPVIVGALGAQINAGNVRYPGVEFAINARPTPEVTLSFSGNWNDNKVSQNLTIPAVTRTGTPVPFIALAKGQRLDYVPEWTLNASIAYEGSTEGNRWAPFARADINFASKRPTLTTFGTGLNAFGERQLVSGLRFGAKNDRYQVAVFVENLFDANPRITAPTVNDGTSQRIRPRTVGLDLKADF